ncbi:MAG: sugar phosphate nucleotidyltransferase [Oscillochloridaceae bacterium umkhey_bin13]
MTRAARHAVILAAGESTRTRPLTLHRPKPLLPLLDRPLLAHILDQLVGLVTSVTLVVGYRAEQIEATFGAAYHGIKLRYVHQSVVNGTAGAVLAAGPINEPFFLLYGDNLIAREDLLGVAAAGRYAVAGLPVADARAFGVLQISAGVVQGIHEKPSDPPPDALANPGIYQFDQAVFPLLNQITPSTRGELELTDLIGALAQAGTPAYPHRCTGYWVPVGNPWEALSAALFLAMRQPQGSVVVHPTATVASSATLVGPVVIGPHCQIGADATISASVLEAGVQVGPAAQIAYSWIEAEAQIGAGATLQAAPNPTLQPAAEVHGSLSREQLITRGSIIGRGAIVAAGTCLAPETITTVGR